MNKSMPCLKQVLLIINYSYLSCIDHMLMWEKKNHINQAQHIFIQAFTIIACHEIIIIF